MKNFIQYRRKYHQKNQNNIIIQKTQDHKYFLKIKRKVS
jgi:hypothetical protein